MKKVLSGKIKERISIYKIGMICGFLEIIAFAEGKRAKCGMAKKYFITKCIRCGYEKEMALQTMLRAKRCKCSSKYRPAISKELILKHFDYDKVNGTLKWKDTPHRNRKLVIGKEGAIKNNYWSVWLNIK